MKKFEEAREKKNKELEKVLSFIMDTVGIKTTQGILLGRSSCQYFRGVNFHPAVLANGDHIMKMIPSFVEDGQIKELKTMADSIRLG